MTMTYKLAETLLTRDEVVAEVVRLANNLELTADDFHWLYGATSEVVNDPSDTLNHQPPAKCLDDYNALSDYYYLIACDAEAALRG